MLLPDLKGGRAQLQLQLGPCRAAGAPSLQISRGYRAAAASCRLLFLLALLAVAGALRDAGQPCYCHAIACEVALPVDGVDICRALAVPCPPLRLAAAAATSCAAYAAIAIPDATSRLPATPDLMLASSALLRLRLRVLARQSSLLPPPLLALPLLPVALLVSSRLLGSLAAAAGRSSGVASGRLAASCCSNSLPVPLPLLTGVTGPRLVLLVQLPERGVGMGWPGARPAGTYASPCFSAASCWSRSAGKGSAGCCCARGTAGRGLAVVRVLLVLWLLALGNVNRLRATLSAALVVGGVTVLQREQRGMMRHVIMC